MIFVFGNKIEGKKEEEEIQIDAAEAQFYGKC